MVANQVGAAAPTGVLVKSMDTGIQLGVRWQPFLSVQVTRDGSQHSYDGCQSCTQDNSYENSFV